MDAKQDTEHGGNDTHKNSTFKTTIITDKWKIYGCYMIRYVAAYMSLLYSQHGRIKIRHRRMLLRSNLGPETIT